MKALLRRPAAAVTEEVLSFAKQTIPKVDNMALMCPLNGCGEKKGPCKHEKGMMLMAVVIAIGGLAHFWLHLF